MTRRPNAATVGDRNIAAADRVSKRKRPAVGRGIGETDELLRIPVSREPWLPEPVDVSAVNGRRAQPWEADLITEVRLAERAREARILP